jgi:hypothetical protein
MVLARMRGLDALPMWVVYDHPSDYPNNYVARLWVWDDEAGAYVATDEQMVCPDLDVIRRQLHLRGLVKLDRQRGDDTVILETWL